MLIIGCFSVLTYLSLVVHARRLNQLIKNSHEQTMKTNHLFPSIRFQRPLCFLSSMVFILTPPLVAQSPVLKDATVEKIATGFQFTEGPCWRTAGYLVFSDIQGNTVYKWTPEQGAQIFLQPSGNSNGLAEDNEGRLLLAQHGKRRIAHLEADGTETALATQFNGKRLNSPNDIAVKSDGAIYFTDPPYGINSSQEELGFYGVYRLSPDGSDLALLVDSLYRPNGLAFSPDGQFIDKIAVPERTRNLAWGDKDRKTLYITAGASVYRIRLSGQESLPEMVLIPGSDFEMGDHHNLGGLEHRSDEIPIHTVRIDLFFLGKYEITNEQYCAYLNSALYQNWIEVRNGFVYAMGGNDIYCETDAAVTYSGIHWDGSSFSVRENRDNHPMVGVRWCGALAYCNWLSLQNGYQECYNLTSWICNFSRDGFRLPTEAEWEYAAQGGQYNPYRILPWGDDMNEDGTLANWPDPGDPYEIGPYLWTTPIGFYNGDLHQKSEFNWPDSQQSYQTRDSANACRLYDLSGNVWEWVYDWYGRDYYSVNPSDNPTGPETGTPMPDGKPYRTLRSGNWYNGKQYWGILVWQIVILPIIGDPMIPTSVGSQL